MTDTESILVEPVGRPKSVILFIALWIVVLGSFWVVLWAFDKVYVSDRDDEICALIKSQAAVVTQLIDDLASNGQPISPELSGAVDALKQADCDDGGDGPLIESAAFLR